MNKSCHILSRSCHIFPGFYQDLTKILPRYFVNKSCHIFLRSYQDLVMIFRTNLTRSCQDLCKIFKSSFQDISITNLTRSCQVNVKICFHDLCKQEQILSYLSQDLYTITRWSRVKTCILAHSCILFLLVRISNIFHLIS